MGIDIFLPVLTDSAIFVYAITNFDIAHFFEQRCVWTRCSSKRKYLWIMGV